MKHSNLFIDIYFFGNIVITLGNYTRRNRWDGGQSQAVNNGLYNSSYSHHL